jgi:hypothetical protein
MTSKMYRIALTVVASFAFSSTAWASCSNTSLSGAYRTGGFHR